MGAQEEVKIVLRTEATGDGAEKTAAGMDRVTQASERAERAIQQPPPTKQKKTPEEKQQRDDEWREKHAQSQAAIEQDYAKKDAKATPTKETKAESMRKMRASIAKAELDLVQAKAEGRPEDETQALQGILRERKLAARFMREQGMSPQKALDQAGSMVLAQTDARATTEKEKAVARETAAALKAAEAKEKATARETAASQKAADAEEKKAGRTSVVIGTQSAAVAGWMIREAVTDYSERQGISNRDQAQRAIDTRRLGIMGGWRGTASDVQAAEFATEDRIFERGQNRKELERKASVGVFQGAMGGAAAGAAAGSFIPGLGTLLGAIIGGLGGAGSQYLSGRRELNADSTAQKKDQDLLQQQRELGRKKFETEEGALGLDAIRQRSKRTMEGNQEAIVDDAKINFIAKYRRMRDMHASPEEAEEGAALSVETQIRNKQAAIGNSLVDARSGSSDIAAAAEWSQKAMAWGSELRPDLHAIVNTIEANSEKARQQRGQTDLTQ